MEKSQNFLTIKAFAEAAGRSQQTIYKQIGTRLAHYVHEIEGQKYIEHRALKEVFGIDVEQPVQPKDDNSFNRDETSEHPLYAILKEELEAKNRQIEQLQDELAEERKHSREQAEKLAQLADQAQKLHAGSMQRQLSEGVPEEISVTVEQDPAPEEPPEEPARKTLGWWLRSFFG